jgi:hypothetical protein
VISHSDLLGRPATIFLTSAEAAGPPLYARNEFVGLLRLAWRRSAGRLWILCQGTSAACGEALRQFEEVPDFRPIVVYEAQGNIGSICPSSDGVNTVIHLDSTGNVLTYGYVRPGGGQSKIIS